MNWGLEQETNHKTRENYALKRQHLSENKEKLQNYATFNLSFIYLLLARFFLAASNFFLAKKLQ